MITYHRYKRIANTLKYSILNGTYQVGEKLPSIRLMAKQENCNSATIHHALKHLEKANLIIAKCTKGYFVIDDPLMLSKLRYQEGATLSREFYRKLRAIGYSDAEINILLNRK